MVRTFVVASILAVASAACSGADGETNSPETSAPTSSASPSLTVPPYLASYSPSEREAYEEAVAAYETYVAKNNRFLAKGRTTRDARNFYHRYSIDWVVAWANLAQLANNNVRITGSAAVKWVRPARVTVGANKSVVVLRRCLDESEIVVTQKGDEVEQPMFKKPHVYRVTVEKRAGESWWRSGSADQGATC